MKSYIAYTILLFFFVGMIVSIFYYEKNRSVLTHRFNQAGDSAEYYNRRCTWYIDAGEFQKASTALDTACSWYDTMLLYNRKLKSE